MKYYFILLILFNNLSFAKCKDEIEQVDKAWKLQYHTETKWWQRIIECEVCLDTELRKDAIINKEQSRKIGFYRNIAYSQMSRGDEKMCLETIKIPKQILRL